MGTGVRAAARALLEIVSPRVSFSQHYEDALVARFASEFGMPFTHYVDVGCNDPIAISNTYLFYKSGLSGVAIDPQARLKPLYAQKRPRDVFVNAAIGTSGQPIVLHVVDQDGLSTTDAAEAERMVAMGHQIAATATIPTRRLDEVIDAHLPAGAPFMMSLDVEGSELDVLASNDWSRRRPRFMVIETIRYERDWLAPSRKDGVIDAHVASLGYLKVGDTYLNSIYVDLSAKPA